MTWFSLLPNARTDLAALAGPPASGSKRRRVAYGIEIRANAAPVAGEPRVVLISGVSGAGKSALVSRFLDEIAADGQAMVIPGRCYERESVPFKAVDDLIDNLCQRLAALPRKRAGQSPRTSDYAQRLLEHTLE